MNFKKWLESVGMVDSLEDALHTLGLKRGASEEDIRKAHRDSSMKNHPDRGGSVKAQAKANAAFDFLREKGFNTSGGSRTTSSEFRPNPHSGTYTYRDRDLPPWQTDSRSSYNEVGGGFRNINFCKKAIYEKAIEKGPVEKWTIQAFDGSYFRGVFIVFCNPETLGFAGEVMDMWNHNGSNSYATNAVFAHKQGSKDLILVRIRGRDVSKEDIVFSHDAFNENPANDTHFMRHLKDRLEEIEDGLGMRM
jgi:hypothetical protein